MQYILVFMFQNLYGESSLWHSYKWWIHDFKELHTQHELFIVGNIISNDGFIILLVERCIWKNGCVRSCKKV